MAGSNSIHNPPFTTSPGTPEENNLPKQQVDYNSGFYRGYYARHNSSVQQVMLPLLPSQFSLVPIYNYSIAAYSSFPPIYNQPRVSPPVATTIHYTAPPIRPNMTIALPCLFTALNQPLGQLCWTMPINPLSAALPFTEVIANHSFLNKSPTSHTYFFDTPTLFPSKLYQRQSYPHIPETLNNAPLNQWAGNNLKYYVPPIKTAPDYTYRPEKKVSELTSGLSNKVLNTTPHTHTAPISDPVPDQQDLLKTNQRRQYGETDMAAEQLIDSFFATPTGKKAVTSRHSPNPLNKQRPTQTVKPTPKTIAKERSGQPPAKTPNQRIEKDKLAPIPKTDKKTHGHPPPPTQKPSQREIATWPTLLQVIYQKRESGENAISDLVINHQKTKHWSWQWFPTIFRENTSAARKACAFRTLDELLQYYNTPALRDTFIELAELAVRCPMNLDLDEKYLLESLLLCRYAAVQSFDSTTGRKLSELIRIQKNKEISGFYPSEQDINNWLDAEEVKLTSQLYKRNPEGYSPAAPAPPKADQYPWQKELQLIANTVAIDRFDRKRDVDAKQIDRSGSTDDIARRMNDKLAENEGDLENISIPNRPMSIAGDYDLFTSNAWLNAKTQLDNSTRLTEKAKCTLLVDILLKAEKQAYRQIERAKNIIHQQLEKNGCNNTALFNRSMDEIRRNEALCKQLAHEVCHDLLKHGVSELSKGSHHTHKYIEEACLIAVKMHLQRPPMHFSKPGKEGLLFDQANQIAAHFGSELDTPPFITSYYIYPALVHGDKIMKPAKAFLLDPAKRK